MPGTGQALYWDSVLEGFGVRVLASGVKTYVAQSRVGGKSRRVNLFERHELIEPKTYTEAINRAKVVLGKLKSGEDVSAKRRADKVAEFVQNEQDAAAAATLQGTLETYFAAKQLRDSTMRDYRRHVECNFSDWAELPVGSITEDMVERRFTELTARAPVASWRTSRALLASTLAIMTCVAHGPSLPTALTCRKTASKH